MKSPAEKDIQKLCMDWLFAHGALPIRINSGAMMAPATATVKRKFIRFTSEPGCADVLVCFPKSSGGATFLSVEVKRPGNKPTADQQVFAERVRRAGGIAVTVTGLDDLVRQLTDAGVL